MCLLALTRNECNLEKGRSNADLSLSASSLSESLLGVADVQ